MMETIDLNAGAIAPVADEVTVTDLRVTGRLPTDLRGRLIRNGPNPFDGRFAGNDMLAWWVGPAMVHAVAIEDGRAIWYRNRWVHTAHLDRHRGAELGPDPLRDQNPNVNVIIHHDSVLALGEGGRPFVLDDHLATAGPAELGPMTAHPKIDPNTGELVWFRADWQAPFLRYGAVDAVGRTAVAHDIDLPAPTMMHDFAITATKALFLDLNVGYDFSMLQHGAAIPLRWDDTKAARIGVMGRAGGPVRWFQVESCFIQHVVNAYDCQNDNGGPTIVFDAVRYDRFLDFDPGVGGYRPNPLGSLWRFTLDLSSGRVDETQLDDRHVEMPRIDERRTGLRHRYVYTVAQPTDVEMRGIVKFDLDAGTSAIHEIPPGDQNSEPVFVPRSPDTRSPTTAEDDGWILACVYRSDSDTTDVVVLDAGDITCPPVATVHLPRRIPAGFHGAWIPAG